MTPACSPKQHAFIFNTHARVIIADGSIRSGKTWASLVRYMMLLANPPTGGSHVITGKSLDSIHRNIFLPFHNEPSLKWAAPHVHYKPGANTANILGTRVEIISGNDQRSETRLRGLTAATVLADEITVLPENFFKQLLGRMSPPGATLIGTTNPDSPRHWLKRDYLDRATELDWEHVKFTMDDNTALSETYKEAIKNEYTGLWYDRFILGKWTAAEGAIYSNYNHALHTIDWDEIPEMATPLAIGIDYGTTNATAAIALALGTDGRLYALDEWRIDQSNRLSPLTDSELSAKFQTWIHTLQTPGTNEPFNQIFLDPSAASFRAQLNRDHVQYVREANNDVLPGIQTVANLITQDKLRVTTRCPGLLEEISTYTWDPKATTAGKDAPIKTNDHSVDALRYAVHTTTPWWRNHVQI